MSDEEYKAIEVSPDNVMEILSALMEYMYQERGIKGVEDIMDTVNDLAASYAQVEILGGTPDEIKNRMN